MYSDRLDLSLEERLGASTNDLPKGGGRVVKGRGSFTAEPYSRRPARNTNGISTRRVASAGRNEQRLSSKSVFVNNLSFDTTWQSLKEHMKAAGWVIRADVMMDESGRSKGCGLVEFESYEDARTAMQTLDGSELDGRQIFVREDREGGKAVETRQTFRREEFDGGFQQRDNPVENPQGRQIFVGNLPYSVSWQDLKDFFRSFGSVVRVDVLFYSDGQPKGAATVLYATHGDAKRAIREANEAEFDGRVIFVQEDKFAS